MLSDKEDPIFIKICFPKGYTAQKLLKEFPVRVGTSSLRKLLKNLRNMIQLTVIQGVTDHELHLLKRM